MPKIIQNQLKNNTMEFPIYTKHPKGYWYSKLISTKECVYITLEGNFTECSIQIKKFAGCTSSEWDDFEKGKDIQCTREEFMKAYNKAIETINSKL